MLLVHIGLGYGQSRLGIVKISLDNGSLAIQRRFTVIITLSIDQRCRRRIDGCSLLVELAPAFFLRRIGLDKADDDSPFHRLDLGVELSYLSLGLGNIQVNVGTVELHEDVAGLDLL